MVLGFHRQYSPLLGGDVIAQNLVPAVRIFRKTQTLHPYDAKTLAGRRLHHHLAPQAAHHRGTQLLQACHFGWVIVGLDV
jgi:hypothetical protein